MNPSRGYAWQNAWVEARRRLDLLEECWDPRSHRCLAETGLQPGWRCLEVGGGGGSIVRWLCEAVGPEGRVVTVDIDTRFLKAIDAPNLEVIEADVVRDGVPDGPFDLVHTRSVLVHIPERDALVAALVERLAPGGVLLLEETDFFSIEGSPSALYRDTLLQCLPIFAKAGVHGSWSRSLGSRLVATGLENVEAEAAMRIFRGGSSEAEFYRMTYTQARDLLLAGGVNEAVFDEFLALFDDHQQWFPSLAMVIASGRRPA